MGKNVIDNKELYEAMPQTDKAKSKPLNRQGAMVTDHNEDAKVENVIPGIQSFLRALCVFAVTAFDFKKLDSKFKMSVRKEL